MSSCAMSTPPREPCMTAAAAITRRGTAVSRSSMTSATNKLLGDENILLVAVVPDVGIPVLLIRFVGGVRPFANTILYGGLIPPPIAVGKSAALKPPQCPCSDTHCGDLS